MTQLAKVNKDICPILTLEEKQYVLAGMEKRIEHVPVGDITDRLAELIAQASFNCGQGIGTGEDAQQKLISIITSIMPDIKKYFYSLTLSDLAIAFDNGSKKRYGEIFGMNPATIIGWIGKYMSDSNRRMAKKKQQQYDDSLSAPPPLNDSQKEALVKKGVIEAFEIIKSGGDYIDTANVCYNYLDKLKLIPFDKTRKREFIKLAERSLRTGLTSELIASSKPTEKQEIKLVLDNLNTSFVDRIKEEAKKIALYTFFKELIAMGEHIKDRINEIK